MRGNAGRFLLSGWPWRSLVYLAVGATAVVPMLALLKWLSQFGTVGAYASGLLILLAVCFVVAVPLATVERRRLRVMDLALSSGKLRRRSSTGPLHWVAAQLRDPGTWRAFGYAVALALVLGPLDLAIVLTAATILILPITPMLEFLLDIDSMINLGPPGSSPDTSILAKTLVVLSGFVLIPVAAYAVSAVAASQAALTRLMLAPRGEEITAWGRQSANSRTWLASVTEAERRRIERDLHDGAQQRLATLILKLGILEHDQKHCDCGSREEVAAARDDAQLVLADLRRLIRGIHPQSLTNSGIAAAVDELAAQCPIPVSVRIDLPLRPAPEIESAAFFAVNEALANIVKHSHAEHAEVTGTLSGGLVLLKVRDDGVGGADTSDGTGLRGLADRVAVVGGRVLLHSPRGGPTVLLIELPENLIDHA
ncbi:sensor histidine kinase [Amycolatopsis minnesotensis]|uniref:histidine kinase n=2 Tax=Amycolatopsis minnesotensis TaxID=337894 RepID=A0ABN2RVK5_9PSEU